MNYYCLIGIILGAIAGMVLCYRLIKRPIYIMFDYSFLAWFDPIMICFVCIIASFFLDYILGLIAASFASSYSGLSGTDINFFECAFFVVLKAVENGVLISLFSICCSKIFGMICKKSGLMYLYTYSIKVPQICYTIFIVFLSIRLWMLIDWTGQLDDIGFYIVRIIMWLMTALGIWLGFGLGCEVTFEEKDSKEQTKHHRLSLAIERIKQLIHKLIRDIRYEKIKIKEIFPIVAVSGLCVGLLFVPTDFDYIDVMEFLIGFIILFILVIIISLVYVRQNLILSEERSEKLFDELINRMKNSPKKTFHGHFGRMKYFINEYQIHIDEVKIRYGGPRNDAYTTYFMEETIKFKGTHKLSLDDPEGIKKYLADRRLTQEELITKGFDACKDEMIERKKQQLSNYIFR